MNEELARLRDTLVQVVERLTRDVRALEREVESDHALATTLAALAGGTPDLPPLRARLVIVQPVRGTRIEDEIAELDAVSAELDARLESLRRESRRIDHALEPLLWNSDDAILTRTPGGRTLANSRGAPILDALATRAPGAGLFTLATGERLAGDALPHERAARGEAIDQLAVHLRAPGELVPTALVAVARPLPHGAGVAVFRARRAAR
ncbi:hypothetical protein [Sandaracinus amylolyticus]|uniref:Uncharacterized protein n=1 Tax=Sandaracinus amylolyticus TaxID=927083 RepID=A0A0F6SG17_9BACT|nr:hypothetical protein [Sandaracinus amylolyticus]AKF07914.1 hypothetical protein DB32_005063 [Sandaracinus amylolyticus]